MASSDVVKKPPSRRTPAAGRAGWATAVLGGVRRTTLLLVLTAVVLSLGLVAGNGSGDGRAANFSEIAQTDARAAAVELSRQARALAADPAGVPKVIAAELEGQADVLADQSILLVRPGSLRSGALPFPDAAQTPSAPAEAYIQALTASARASLDAAVRADPGTARLLASTGAAQQVLAARAAEAAGIAAPGRWLPVAPTAATPDCAPEAAGSDPADTGTSGAQSPAGQPAEAPVPTAATSGPEAPAPDAAAALQAVVDTEFGAAYAYEVAMARTTGLAAAELLEEKREAHLAAGDQAVDLLPQVCLPALTPTPAYALPASFGADPAGALADLEAATPGVYADLSSLGNGTVRAWAVERLAGLSLDLYTDTRSVPASPGLEAQPAGLPWIAGTA
nr:DUF4439 domain-containing protein [Arthrobacter jiangjiafuii]